MAFYNYIAYFLSMGCTQSSIGEVKPELSRPNQQPTQQQKNQPALKLEVEQKRQVSNAIVFQQEEKNGQHSKQSKSRLTFSKSIQPSPHTVISKHPAVDTPQTSDKITQSVQPKKNIPNDNSSIQHPLIRKQKNQEANLNASIESKGPIVTKAEGNYTTDGQLLIAIRQTILKNQKTYCLISPYVLLQLFNQVELDYYTHSQQISLIDTLLHYLQNCSERCKNKIKRSSSKYFEAFASKILRIQTEVFFENKNALQVMSYIGPSNSKYGSYLALKFDMHMDEAMAVAAKTRQLCKYDLRAFFYLTNYLYRSCYTLEKQGKSIENIEQLLLHTLGKINDAFPPAPDLPESKKLIIHKSEAIDQAKLHYDILDLTKVDQAKRKQVCEHFILDRAKEAQNNYKEFVDLVKQTCEKNGNHFKIGLKIKDKTQKRAIDRVKEKMLDKAFNKYKIQSFSKEAEGSNKTIDKFIKMQEQKYYEQMQNIYKQVKDPIIFKVSDLLRAKCLFRQVDQINSCATSLKEKIEEQKYTLVELDNRLKGKTRTSDIVLKIKVGETISELQLPIEFNIAHNEFSHKIYQVIRSKFFTPLTMLKVINDQISIDYLQELDCFFAVNNAHRSHEEQKKYFELSQTFKSLAKNYEEFKILWDYQSKFQGSSQQLLNIFGKRLDLIKEQSKNLTLTQQQMQSALIKNGKYYFYLHKKELAIEQYKKYIEQMSNKALTSIQKDEMIEAYYMSGLAKSNLTFYQEAIQYYEKALKLQEEMNYQDTIQYATTLNSLGCVFDQLRNYTKSIEYYQKSLKLTEKLSGKESYDYVIRLNNMACLLTNMGKYNQGLKYLLQCQAIQTKIQGKQSIEMIKTLNNIGYNYGKIGKEEQSLIYLIKSLQLTEKLKGKDSMECTKTLTNIGVNYWQRKQNQKAIEYYLRCLQIQKKVVGSEAAECAITYGNLASSYGDLGQYQKAKQYNLKALEIEERIQGKYSLSIAIRYNNMGADCYKRQQYQQAMEFYTKCLFIQAKIVGKQGIECAQTHINMATSLFYLGKKEEAEKQLLLGLDIQVKVSGKDNASTAKMYETTGDFMKITNKKKKAVEFYKEAAEIYFKIEGKQSKKGQQVEQSISSCK